MPLAVPAAERGAAPQGWAIPGAQKGVVPTRSAVSNKALEVAGLACGFSVEQGGSLQPIEEERVEPVWYVQRDPVACALDHLVAPWGLDVRA